MSNLVRVRICTSQCRVFPCPADHGSVHDQSVGLTPSCFLRLPIPPPHLLFPITHRALCSIVGFAQYLYSRVSQTFETCFIRILSGCKWAFNASRGPNTTTRYVFMAFETDNNFFHNIHLIIACHVKLSFYRLLFVAYNTSLARPKIRIH